MENKMNANDVAQEILEMLYDGLTVTDIEISDTACHGECPDNQTMTICYDDGTAFEVLIRKLK